MIDLQTLPNTSGIYCIENTLDGKKYIGQSQNIRKRLVKGHIYHLRCGSHINNHLQAAWSKYGEDSFVAYILEECPCGALDEREMYYIDLFDTKSKLYGYNQTDGGGGRRGYELSEETRQKLSLSNTGKKHSEATRKLLSTIHTGMLVGADHPGARAVRCVTTGLEFATISDAANHYHCQAGDISKCLRGKQVTAGRGDDGIRLKWEAVDGSSTQRGYLYRPVRAREIICVNNGIRFDSLVAAGAYCHTHPNNIGCAAQGRRFSAGKDPATGEKLQWIYAEEVVACS